MNKGEFFLYTADFSFPVFSFTIPEYYSTFILPKSSHLILTLAHFNHHVN
jgi:hypothetical protein